MIARTLASLLVAWGLVARPCAASCEQVAWDLRDVLRDLVETRLAASEALSARQVEGALRARGLPFTSPVFRFARGADRARVAIGRQQGEIAPCEVSETFAFEGAAPVVAALRVESAVESFAVEAEEARWRVVARVGEDLPLAAFEIVVGARTGPARSHAVQREGAVLRASVPRGALEGPVTFQLVAQTPLGPEVVGEVEACDAAGNDAPPRRAPERTVLPPAPLEAALDAARVALGVPELTRSPALARVAESTLAAALARGVLAHQSEVGLVGDRLKAARIPHRRAGELLARVAPREDAVERFLASPAHRLILGDGKLRALGVAQAKGPDGLQWVVVVLATP